MHLTQPHAQPDALRAAASRALHARTAAAGLAVRPPQAGFYVYPDFEPWRDHLAARHHVTTAGDLARLLLHRYGATTLPGAAFGDPPSAAYGLSGLSGRLAR